MGNFNFLKEKYEELYEIANFAEKYVYSDPNGSLFKSGLAAEQIVKYIVSYEGLSDVIGNETSARKLNYLKRDGFLPNEINDAFYVLRIKRNEATHEGAGIEESSLGNLRLLYGVSSWFMEVYGDYNYTEKPFVVPKKVNEKAVSIKEIEENKKELEQKVKELEQKLLSVNQKEEKFEERKKRSLEKAKSVKLNEAQTRELIDRQLRSVGWEADSVNINYKKGIRPEKNKNMAIAEWETDSKINKKGYVDYALFIGEKLVGMIEAKKYDTDISAVLDNQVKDYAENIKREHLEKYCIEIFSDKYYVPFIFAANGRGYIEQFKTKSGIWFRDLRNFSKTSKALHGWPSPQGIEEKLELNILKADNILKERDYRDLQNVSGLNLRYYQIEAIKAVEEAILKGKKEILLAMATGTGKTMTALGMIYRFLKAKRFKRILYLVDRTALGNQTFGAFSNVKIDESLPLTEIYDVKEINDKKIEKETKLHIATVQGMVKKIFFSNEFDDEKAMPSIYDYDCIIVDEAHRGYLLDKELSENETFYRNEQEYRSRYRAVIEYFDAVKIALTATPALHTAEIFGKPVYNYSYRSAVIDGYLVDYNAPHEIKTKLSQEGIKYKKGEQLVFYNPVTKEVENSEELPDEIKFEVETFNKKIVNESFNREVLKEILEDLDVYEEAKTLIFAVNDSHADMIVNILKEEFEKQHISPDAVMKITGSIENGDSKKIDAAIKKFKNEMFPNIAVTVDLLTTGIDIPKISNIVFLRQVKSRILYEQMMGRATRLCKEIGKTHFEVYDAVGLYNVLEDVSTMKPVLTNVYTTFDELIDSFEKLQTEEQKKNQIDILIAKMRRVIGRISKENTEQFTSLTEGFSPEKFIEEIKKEPLGKTLELIKNSKAAFKYLK